MPNTNEIFKINSIRRRSKTISKLIEPESIKIAVSEQRGLAAGIAMNPHPLVHRTG